MEEQFKVGSFYKQKNGVVAEVTCVTRDHVFVETRWAGPGQELEGGGARRLSTGMYVGYASERDDKYTLIPGELEFRHGEWLPISVGAPVVEEKAWKPTPADVVEAVLDELADIRNARMLANDLKHGPAKPYIAPAIVQAPKSTAHPSIPSLSLSPDRAGADHRLGARL